MTSRRSAVPARSHPGSESSASFDEVQFSSLDEARDVCRGAHRPGFRPRSSELEADVEVLDHTNVPWASSTPTMWYYLLGLFRQCRSYWVTLCLRISPKQRLDRFRALVWNRDALRPQSSVSSVRVPLRLDLERASWRETSCACPNPRLILYAVLLGRSSASDRRRLEQRGDQRGEKLSSYPLISCGAWFVVGYVLFWSAGCGTSRFLSSRFPHFFLFHRFSRLSCSG